MCGHGTERAGHYRLVALIGDVVDVDVWFVVAMVRDVGCALYVVRLGDYIAALQQRAIAFRYSVE